MSSGITIERIGCDSKVRSQQSQAVIKFDKNFHHMPIYNIAGYQKKIAKAYIDSEGSKVLIQNDLNKSVKMPWKWQGAARNFRSASNRTSSGEISRKDRINLNNSETIEPTAGVNSGYIERIELEKYNPKHVITPNK